MSESLAIYLHDHLTGASMAIALLESRQKEEYVGPPLGEFAASLQIEVDGDRVTSEARIQALVRRLFSRRALVARRA